MRSSLPQPLSAVLATALVLALGAPVSAAGSHGIVTVAGGLPATAIATSVSLQPAALATGPDGSVYVADTGQNAIWRWRDGQVEHVAGTGAECAVSWRECQADGGPATRAYLATPAGLAVAPDGDVYVSEVDTHSVRRIDAGTGRISVVAGTGAPGWSGDDEGKPGPQVRLELPGALAAGPDGSVFVADRLNESIRRIRPDGTVVTVAGCGPRRDGCHGDLVDGAPVAGTNIPPWEPIAIAVDREGTLYLSANGAVFRVREDRYELVAGAAFVHASRPGEGWDGAAGDARFSSVHALAVSPAGELVVLDAGANRVARIDAPVHAEALLRHVAGCSCGPDLEHARNGYSGDGGDARRAAFALWHGVRAPSGVAVGVDGAVFVADTVNNRLRRVGVSGVVATVAGNGYAGGAPGLHALNTLQPEGTDGYLGGFAGDGGPAAGAQLYGPADLAADAAGNVFVLDRHANRVRRIAADGTITTVAGSGCVGKRCWSVVEQAPMGDGGPAVDAQLRGARSITLSGDGTQLYIADTFHWAVRQVNLGTEPVTVFPLSDAPITIAPGEIETVFGDGASTCYGMNPYCGEGLPSRRNSAYELDGLAVDAAGNLYVADTVVNVVNKVDAATGVVTAVAGVSHVSGCNEEVDDGLPARSTRLCGPTDIAIGPDGALHIAEAGHYALNESLHQTLTRGELPLRSLVRRVDLSHPAQLSTVVAGGGGVPGLDGDGGPARSAQVAFPHGLAFDTDGSLLIADTGNSRIRRVRGGRIETVAGDGSLVGLNVSGCGFDGDGGPAARARLCGPLGVAVTPDGTIYVADSLNNRIRAMPPR